MKPLHPGRQPLLLSLGCAIAVLLVWAFLSGTFRDKPLSPAPTAADGPQTAATPDFTAPPSQRPGAIPKPAVGPTAPARSESEPRTAAEFLAFHQWLGSFLNLPSLQQSASLEEGLALARARRPVMEQLIRANPRAALAQSLRWDQWAALPSPLQAEVERPFSELVNYTLFPVCPGPAGAPLKRPEPQPHARVEVQFRDGERVGAFVYGKKNALSSKRGIAVQGIALSGVAALRDGVFQQLLPEEAVHAEKVFPSGQPDPALSFVTGKPITGEAVTALAGGKRFSFANVEELASFDTAIASLDAKPGPKAGSRAIFSLPYSATGAGVAPGAFDFAAAQEGAAAAAAGWTSGEKKVFLIRVSFPDRTEEPVTREAASTVINGTVSSSIREFSYGKTWITATVSANVYRLPLSSGSYAGTVPSGAAIVGFSSNMTQLLEDARSRFRALKAGEDAGIQIGTGAVEVGGADLGDYDIVGMVFSDIGCYSNGVALSGLASVGGGDLWIQGTNDPKVYVHEFGHVYGLGHSNFWQTTTAGETSAVGPGTEEEYGDVYDVMGSGELPLGHFHPQAKQKLNWLTPTQWQDASTAGSGVYRIYRHDSALTTGSLRGVRLTKGTADGESEYYWVGYRPAYADNPHLAQGAYLLWQRPASLNAGEKCCLLDTTPLTSGVKTDAGLNIGRTYSDRAAKIHLTPVGRGGAGGEQYLDVQIHVGTLTSDSGLSLTLGGTSALQARTTATYTAEATCQNGDVLSYYWEAGDGTTAGGTGSGSATFSHAWTAGGTYTLTVTLTDMKGGKRTSSKVVNVSDPAQRFAASDSLTTDDLNALAASPNLLVVVGEQNPGTRTNTRAVIRTSPDGVTWTARGVPEITLNLRLKAVVWDGLQFVAVGEDYNQDTKIVHGVVYTSANGITWTREFADTTAETGLNAVCATGGAVVAVGDSGTVLRKATGASEWRRIVGIPAVSDGAMSCRGVAFGGGTLALTARSYPLQSGGGVVCTSIDAGLTWTEQTAGAGLSTGEDLEKIAYLNGNFITSGWFSKLKTSGDGARTFTTTRVTSEEAFVLAYTPGLYFAGGVSRKQNGTSTTEQSAYLYSTDGKTWVSTVPQNGVQNQNDGLFFNNRLVSVGTGGAIWRSEPLGAGAGPGPGNVSIITQSRLHARSPITFVAQVSNPDNRQLTYHWDAGEGTVANNQSVFTHTWAAGGTYTVSLTVTDGRGSAVGNTKTVNVYDPAQDFSPRTTGTTDDLNAIAASSTRVVAAGDNGRVLTSEDGTIWTSRTLPGLSQNITFEGAVWDGQRFVLVGYDYDSVLGFWVGVIYTSADGSTWQRAYKSTGEDTRLRSVTCAGGTLLAGGDKGQLLRSTDAASWSNTSLSLPNSLSVTGLASGEGVFVAVVHTLVLGGFASGDGRVYTSTNGATWVDRTSGAGLLDGRDFNSVAYLNNRFVASGWFSKLCVSTDKGASFQTTRIVTENTPALAAGGGVYLAAGVDQDNDDANVRLLSSDGNLWTQTPAPAGVTPEKAAAFFKNTFLLVGGSGQIFQSAPVGATGDSLEILLHPESLSVTQGEGATFTVVAAGAGTLSYQWYKGATALAGGTLSTYSIQSTTINDAGSYSVRISDSQTASSLTSSAAVLAVATPTTEPGTLVSAGPPSLVSLVKGSDATIGVTLSAAGDGVVQTTYLLYSGSGAAATPTAISGTVPPSGTAVLPLKGVTLPGTYFVRFTRIYNTGPATTDETAPFTVSFKTWDAAAGTYQTLLAQKTGTPAGLGDGGAYRGLLTLTVTRTGVASGRLSYNEATLLEGGTSNERVYAPVVRTFTGRLIPKPGDPTTMQLSPKLTPSSAQGRELVTLELDLSRPTPTLATSVADTVSLSGGSLVSESAGVTAGTALLSPDLAPLAGRYTLAANLGNLSATNDQRAYVYAAALSSGRVLWNTRLNGYTGTGTSYLNVSDPARPTAQFYEGRQVLSASLHNATSLLGVLNFQIHSGTLWAAAFGSLPRPEALEKQASYLARQTVSGVLKPVYTGSLFATGENHTGTRLVSFSDKNTARWSGASYKALPSFLPTAQTLTLTAEDPLSSTGLSFRWQATISSTGAVRTVPQTASDGVTLSPTLSLSLARSTGLWTGGFTLAGARRTLSGASVDPSTVSGGSRAAQGFAERGSAPNLRTGTWTLSR